MRTTTAFLILLLISLIAFLGCGSGGGGGVDPSEADSLVLLASYDTGIIEPSGLTYDAYHECLWTVSDEDGGVYQLSLDGIASPNAISSLSTNLEGITFNYLNNTLFFIDEILNEIRYFDSNWIVYEFFDFNNYLDPNDPNGIEGIAYDPNLGCLYVVTETNPGTLFTVDTDNFGTTSITNQVTLDFADDYSGLYVEPNSEFIWILSHESQTVYKYHKTRGLEDQYLLDIEKPEGLAIYNGKFYIVSDETEKLYVLELQ
jgi:uncharacterized protein YjiK